MPVAISYRALWLGVALTSALASSCGKRDGNDATAASASAAIGIYAPSDAVAESWGAFDFYGSHATLAAFQGHLALESVGAMPDSAGEELAGAQVYRIANAEEHHAQNSSRDMRCLSPARWLAIKAVTPTPPNEPAKIRVALLMSAEWSSFAPGKPGYCGSGVYALN